MADRPERCDQCKWSTGWDLVITGLGECHRFPPTMTTERRRDADEYDTIRHQDGGWPLVFEFTLVFDSCRGGPRVITELLAGVVEMQLKYGTSTNGGPTKNLQLVQ